MFREFVDQAKRLFSSKQNGGKLVYNLTDKLHYYKVILLATSMILLLGYGQFRPHFYCPASGGMDRGLTNFCWINGTTTVNRIDGATATAAAATDANSSSYPAAALSRASGLLDQIVPHVGVHYRVNEGRYELINHNYMRSLWALLILMAACSYLAQRRWASLFAQDLLRALLKLPANEELSLVKKAQNLRLYHELTKGSLAPRTHFTLSLPSNLTMMNNEQPGKEAVAAAAAAANEQTMALASRGRQQVLGSADSAGQMFVHKIEIFPGDQNDHDHALDYYPNQLLYLLLSEQTSAYKSLAQLHLRRRLLAYSCWSLLLTCLQFALPWCFIGRHYTLYGWHWAQLVGRHLWEQLSGAPNSNQLNSLDYELGSRIWPILTQCEFKQLSRTAAARILVQCTVSINEICAKLFAIIWWFVVVNIAIELWCCGRLIICSVNFSAVQWSFGYRFWPKAQQEASDISAFRFRHANSLANIEAERAERQLLDQQQQQQLQLQPQPNSYDTNQLDSITRTNNAPTGRQQVLSASQRKQLEARRTNNGGRISGNDDCSLPKNQHHHHHHHRHQRRWYLLCLRDTSLFLASNNSGKDKQQQVWKARQSPSLSASSCASFSSAYNLKDTYWTRSGQVRRQQQESEHDMDLYFLLYLLYLRLDCSRKNVEQVIRMTSEALAGRLEGLKQCEWSFASDRLHEGSSSAEEALSGSTASTTTTTTPSTASTLATIVPATQRSPPS